MVIPITDGEIDLGQRCVRQGGRALPLTDIEAALLAYLCARPDQVVSRTDLLTEVWGYHPDSQTRAVDAAVSRLRTKLEGAPAQPRHLLTERGVGYRFVPLTPVATGLVGRTELLADVSARAGLVTLVGPGGVGKTALARALAPDVFVDLSDARTLDHCLVAVSVAVGAPLVGRAAGTQIEALGHALDNLGGARVVLDNAEQVLADVRGCVGAWLSVAPGLALVVTSREALGLDVEQVVPVPPLSSAAATRLIAGLVPPGWTADPALPALLHQLDHLPLALELAAGRAHVLSAAQILARLPTAGKAQGARHASVTASIDWSWALLEPVDRAALAAASTFAGEFTLEDTEAVLPAPEQAPDRLASLTEKHLIQRTERGFRLLETIRAFAWERLAQDDLARARHARWCLEQAATGREDLPNLLRALDALEQEEARRLALEVGVAATEILYRRGPPDLHHQLVARCSAWARSAPRCGAAFEALLAQADLHRRAGAHAAADETIGEALERARALGDRDAVARALAVAATIAHYAGWPDADARFSAAVEAAEPSSPRAQAEVLRAVANRHIDRGELPAAEAANAQALHLLRLAGDTAAEATLLGTLGVVALEDGRHAEARASLARALALHTQHADRRFAAVAQSNLAQAEHLLGHLDAARQHAQESLVRHERMGNLRFAGFARYILAAVNHEQGALNEALTELTHAVSLWTIVDERRFAGYGACRMALLEAARGVRSAAHAAARTAEAQLPPADSVFARWVLEGGPTPAGTTCFGRICVRLIERAGPCNSV